MPKNAVISLNNLSVARDNVTVCHGISFSLTKGQCCVITGKNGSGKTSLLRTLAGFIPHSFGEISGIAGDSQFALQLQSIFLGQAQLPHPNMKVQEYIDMMHMLFGFPQNNDAINAFGIDEIKHKYIGNLSIGWQRRVMIAAMINTERCLWLLDEPMQGLDRDSQNCFLHFMNLHMQNGGAVVMASHDDLAPNNTFYLKLEVGGSLA